MSLMQQTPGSEFGDRPQRARLVLRLGVTGHRVLGPTADVDLLKIRIGELFDALASSLQAAAASGLYSDAKPVLRVISPVAEGADRIVALVALEHGFELLCPLPFSMEEYENDFDTPASRQEYRRLLEAATVFELDGSRAAGREDFAYEAVGRLVIRHCDLLLAIWDGSEAAGRGGTGQIVSEAIAFGLPVVRIDSSAPDAAISMLGEESSGDVFVALRRRVENTVAPPDVGTEGLREAYFAESRPRKNYTAYASLEAFVAEGKIRWSRKVQPPEALHLSQLDSHYHWADMLAVHYGSRSRSAHVRVYVLAWAAVLLALLAVPIASSWAWVWPRAELALIVLILVTVVRARKGKWHERWLAYRLLSERLRTLDFLAPLARTTPEFHPPAYIDAYDPTLRWVDWHFRAIVRECGLCNARVDARYLNDCWQIVRSAVEGQSEYHAGAAARLRTVHHRLHTFGEGLFFATLLVCIGHILAPLLFQTSESGGVANWLILAAAALPAAGAASAGILAQEESKRLAARYSAMHRRLDGILKLMPASPAGMSLEDVGATAETAALTMVGEVQDWHVLVKARTIVLPG
jgi:hypothetical protein